MWAKRLNAKDIHKEMLFFTVGSVCRVKRSQQDGKLLADDQEIEREVRKWLRQQPKHFSVAGFDTLIKRWDKCIKVSGEYVEKYEFEFY
jgi:hypothetical protein